ncbi:MAG: hypothetical protein QUS14_07625 [Pyrinomonadaceae bacterium]|nr:hypothetical protein [Pyrinomonadaceae bacterium]
MHEQVGPSQGTSDSVTTTTIAAPFKDVVWENEGLSFYLPCEIADNESGDTGDSSPAAMETREFVCDLQIIKYSVAITRTKADARTEFNKLQNLAKSRLTSMNRMPMFETDVNNSGHTTVRIDGHPETKSYFSQGTKTRTILLDKNRILTLKAACKAAEIGYCEKLFGEMSESTKKFFGSVTFVK